MANDIGTQAGAAGQQAIDAAENAVKEGVDENKGQIADDVRELGGEAKAGAGKLHDDVIQALKTIIEHVFDGEAHLIEAAGGNLPFPLNLLAPTLLGIAQKFSSAAEEEVLSNIDKADAYLLSKFGAASEVLQADLDKYLPPKS